MKKTTLLFYFLFLSITSAFAQTDFYTCIPGDGGTSGNARAPHGRFRYQRGVALIKATEMTASGIVSGDVINSIAFNYLIAQDVTTSGTMTLYLENTTDVTNTKALTWSTTGMTTVSNGAVTIPNTAGNAIFNFSGGSPFTYTGGGVYVAFDYQNATNPLPTTFATVECNSTGLASGFKGAQSDTAIPTTIAASNFRPVILLGKAVACARPRNIQEVVASKTTTSVTGTWTNVNNTSIEYGLYGFTPGTGTVINGITSPYTLSGLAPSSVYDVYFRNNCGTVTTPINSAVSDVEVFHTVFEPTNPTYATSFEQEQFPYIGWLTTTGANAWFINFGGTGSPLVQSGLSSAVAITPTAAAANDRLFSRGINLTAGQPATITYYVRNYVNTAAPVSTNTASYQLTVGNAQTAAAQTTVVATETGLNNPTFVQKTFTYTPTTTGVHYFGFLHNSPANATGTHALIIDTFEVTQPLATDEFIASKLSVYPNPANDFITISNTAGAIINVVEITDLNGRVVSAHELNGTEGQINTANLASGVYMLNITTDQGSATKKIVKQ
jgi:Secretion system C-terminal sorting domain